MATIEELYQLYIKYPAISTDSRSLQVGSIFFALKGDNFDGNKFALDAIQQGCVAAIVDDSTINDERCFYVENVLKTLQNLSTMHRRALGVKVLAITGSNGKTTTKELVSTVLSKKYRVYATKGNLNNHIGVPLTLLSLTKNIDIAVVEMGANHPGEIKLLSSIAEPDYGIITNIGIAHLEGFVSFEGVKQTKGELYQFIRSNKGKIFYNPSNNNLVELIEKFELHDYSIPYGFGLEATAIDNTHKTPFLGLSLKPTGSHSFRNIQTSLVGDYNYENVLASITVGLYMGISLDLINEALEGYTPSNSRSQLVETKQNTVILDAYNANPSSMEVAIKNFASIENPNKVVIVGEMLELGDHSALEHKRIADLVKSYKFSSIIFIGQGFENDSENCLFFKDADSCSKFVLDNPIKNALILLKGSRGVKLEKVMERL